MPYLNLNNVSKLEVEPKTLNWHYDFIPGKLNFWGNWREGFWTWHRFEDYTEAQLLKSNKNCYIQNDTLYYKPHIYYYLNNGDREVEWFEDIMYMDTRLNEIKTLMGPEWIKLRT